MPKVLVAGVTANTATYTAAAQVITFTYSIKNGGAAALGPDQFRITSSLAANQPAPCGNPNILIAPNETITCQVQYAISAADMNAASIVNQVTASGGGVSASQPASVTLTKGAVPNQSTLTPGSTIQHTVSTGEWLWHIARCYGADPNAVIQANRQLADPAEIERGMVLTIPNIGSRGTIYGLPCVVQHTVAAGETWASIAQLYNADPNILQMIKANTLAVGSVMYVPKNSAGSGATLPVARNLSLTVSASQTTYDQTGQQIVFTYLLKNTGNTTLGPDQFKVTDTLIGTQPFNCGDPGTTLAPGTTLSCTSTYTISQADMNVASISNVATALGGAAQSQATGVTLNRGARSLSLAVTASTAVYGSAGQQITFTYVIKNNGTSTLGPAQFTISDALFGTTPLSCGAANTTLAPNATVTCAYVYTITAADMTVTSIINLATASGGGAGPSSAVSVTITRQ
jgi:LysM repeat protein